MPAKKITKTQTAVGRRGGRGAAAKGGTVAVEDVGKVSGGGDDVVRADDGVAAVGVAAVGVAAVGVAAVGVAAVGGGGRVVFSGRREEVEAVICERISEGRSLAAVCREAGMPSCQSVHRWREEDKGFAARLARAREDGFEAIAHRLREIARGRGESSGDLPRDKLIIDTDLKLLSKWAPRLYGDKVDVSASHAGEIRIVMGGDAV